MGDDLTNKRGIGESFVDLKVVMELRNALFSYVLQGVYCKLEESVQSQSENACVGCVFRKGRQWCPMCQLQPNKGKL